MSLAKEMELNEGWRLCLVDDAALDGEYAALLEARAAMSREKIARPVQMDLDKSY